MTLKEEHLVDHMTTKLIAQAEADSQARGMLQEMIAELAAEIVATKTQLRDARALTGNQGLAIHHLDEKLEHHVKLAQHTPLDAE